MKFRRAFWGLVVLATVVAGTVFAVSMWNMLKEINFVPAGERRDRYVTGSLEMHQADFHLVTALLGYIDTNLSVAIVDRPGEGVIAKAATVLPVNGEVEGELLGSNLRTTYRLRRLSKDRWILIVGSGSLDRTRVREAWSEGLSAQYTAA